MKEIKLQKDVILKGKFYLKSGAVLEESTTFKSDEDSYDDVNEVINEIRNKTDIVDVVSDEVAVVDEFGDEWSFIGDGYKVNDNVTLVIHNNTTMNTIADDKIIDIK